MHGIQIYLRTHGLHVVVRPGVIRIVGPAIGYVFFRGAMSGVAPAPCAGHAPHYPTQIPPTQETIFLSIGLWRRRDALSGRHSIERGGMDCTQAKQEMKALRSTWMSPEQLGVGPKRRVLSEELLENRPR